MTMRGPSLREEETHAQEQEQRQHVAETTNKQQTVEGRLHGPELESARQFEHELATMMANLQQRIKLEWRRRTAAAQTPDLRAWTLVPREEAAPVSAIAAPPAALSVECVSYDPPHEHVAAVSVVKTGARVHLEPEDSRV